MLDTGLKGKVALVTGGNSGIGAATAAALSAQGAKVAVHYLEKMSAEPTNGVSFEHDLPGRKAAEKIVREIEEAGGTAALFAADLLYAGSTAPLLGAAESRLGPVQILVNNAAHCELPDSILTASAGCFERHWAVNTRAAALLISQLARRLKELGSGWGRIINISTDAAQSFAGQAAYGSSKAALEALTRSAAVELGPLGITVNAVAPGPIRTGYIKKELEDRVLPKIPMRRLGRPEDVADAVVFLASERAGWITGQVLRVAGGHVM